jgi:hypothetical protein
VDDNQFIVMVDHGGGDRSRLVDGLVAAFPGAVRRKENSADLRGNWVQVWANDDADEKLAADPDTGYLHFRWRVEVTPLDAAADEDHQVALARDLLQHFRAGRAEVLANFEDRL